MVDSENQMWEDSRQGQGEKSYCLRKHFSPKEKVFGESSGQVVKNWQTRPKFF